MITTAQVLLQNGRLKVAAALPDAEILRKELLNFKVTINPKTAHDSYSHWRESDNDDLVLAVSQGVWFRQFMNRHTDTLLARKLKRTKQRQEAMTM